MRNVKAISMISACLVGILSAGSAVAQTQYVVTGPATSWILQDYLSQNVVLWQTGSSCTNGQIVFPASAAQADKDMLVAMVSTSKATGVPVTVFYTVSAGVCTIASFALAPQ